MVEDPVPLVYSCASSSMGDDVTLPEYDTVMVEDPVVVMVPSQSSTSGLEPALVSFTQVAPPPLTDDTVALPDGHRPTESTRCR